MDFHGTHDENGMLTDYETCSYCTTEVLDSELVDQPDGARICADCARQ